MAMPAVSPIIYGTEKKTLCEILERARCWARNEQDNGDEDLGEIGWHRRSRGRSSSLIHALETTGSLLQHAI